MNRVDDYYEVLGVSEDANEEEIVKAYRREALSLHPDKQHRGLSHSHSQSLSSASSHHAFQLLTEAYNTLKDAKSRREYDSLRKVASTSFGPNRIAAEVDLDEMEEICLPDQSLQWKSPCRCGDYYTITETQLDEGQDRVQCPSCSLVIRVLYTPLH